MTPNSAAPPQIAGELVRLLEGSLRVEDFVATVAHEAAQPLAVIQAMAAGLRQAGDSIGAEQRASMLSEIESQAQFLGSLAQWMVEPFGRETVVFDELVGGVVCRCRALAPEHELSFEPGAPGLSVNCETVRLEASIRNLVKNSAINSPEGSAISVRTHERDGMAVLEVRDEGVGIPEGEWERVFLPYARLQSERTAASGLGLFVVRSCAHQHGGEARVAASAPGGTTMEFTVRATPDGGPPA